MAKNRKLDGKKGYKKIDTKFGELRITGSFVRDVASFSSNGISSDQIMKYYGISSVQWRRLLSAYPTLEEAVDRGNIVTTREIANLLLQKAREGNVQAMIFFLKTRGGFKEATTLQANVTSDKAEISYTLNTTDPVEAARIYEKIIKGS